MTTKHEYLVKHVDLLETQRAQYLLNQYGAEGWEIESVLPIPGRPGPVIVLMWRAVES